MRKLFLLILLLVTLPSLAKDYPMLHYTIEDGLPSNTIYDIYQDPDGMIWIGTDKGISRFNGIKFENFTTADGLSDNECFFFQPDYDGRLWIGTYNGKLCFYKDGVFHNEKNTPWLKLKIKASKTSDIIINKDSSLLVCYHDAPGIVEIKREKISHILTDFMMEQFIKISLFKQSWILNAEKLDRNEYLIYYATTLYNTKSDKEFVKPSKDVKFIRAFINGKNRIFLGEDGKLYSKNRDKIYFNDTLFSKNIYVNDAAIYNNNVFIACQTGLFKNSSPIISNVEFNSVSIDNTETIWAGTRMDGLYRINVNYDGLSSFLKISRSQTTFASRIDNFLIYSTLDRSLYKIDLDNSSYKTILKSTYFNTNKPIINSVHWLNNNNYYNFSSNICFALFDIDKEDFKLVKYSSPNYSFWEPKKVISAKNLLYFKTSIHIALIEKEKLIKKNVQIKPRLVFRNGATYDIEKTENNEIWFSTINNLYKLNDTIPIIQKQLKSISFRQFIFGGHYLIGFTHQNELLIINQYDTENPIIDTIESNNCVWDKLYRINSSTLLIGTNNFFRVLKLFNSEHRAKFTLEVIENPEIPYQPEFVYIDTQNVYFFKKKEISSFPINYVLKKKILPKIKFGYLHIDKEKYYIKDAIQLDYEQSKNLKILFTPISFYHQNLSYEYNISEKGKLEKWISFTGEEINLVKIGYGNFTIQVRAKTLSGDYSKTASFRLQIHKPYWATWWFICFLLVVLVLIITIIARIGIKRRLKKKEGEVRFLRSEYKALNALMNPHFIFNSLNSVQSLINNNENTTASKYIRIFSDLIRQNMRNISNELIPLSKELDLVENYLKIEKLRFKEHLNYSINIEEEVETEMIMIPPLLIQPLVENAIKHGIWPKKSNDGFIQIRIWESENLLKIEIEDNGNGFDQAAKTDTLHESYAMSNIQQRIEQLSLIHSSQITIQIEEKRDDRGNVKGVISTVTIQMPD